MTAYLSDKAGALAPVHGQAGVLQTQYCSVDLGAALTTSDTFEFFDLPENARIHSAILKCSDIDTGSAAVTISVGDSGDADRYFSASTVGQAGTVDRDMAATGQFYKTTARTTIVGSVPTGPATGAAGTLELAISYVVEDSPTSP